MPQPVTEKDQVFKVELEMSGMNFIEMYEVYMYLKNIVHANFITKLEVEDTR